MAHALASQIAKLACLLALANSRVPRRLISTRVAFVAVLLGVMIHPRAAQSQTFTTVYAFTGLSDGGGPLGGVIRDSAGSLYGTTIGGGSHQWGTIFKVDSHGTETVLYSFTGGADGGDPAAGLARDSAGNLYGTTNTAGNLTCGQTSGCGVVFKLDAAGNYHVLYSFSGSVDGGNPAAPLLLDGAGNLYGVSAGGGNQQCFATGCGTVFKLDTNKQFTVLHSFAGGLDGEFPSGNLVRDRAGNLFGTTLQGGNALSSFGTIFEISSAGKETVLHVFAGGSSDGRFPRGGLTLNGNLLYGTTTEGGPSDTGTVFQVDKNNAETVLHSFAKNTGGSEPQANLARDAAGNLYGTTLRGGAANLGTVFKMDSSGNVTELHHFTGASNDGRTPSANLIVDGSGNIYGVAGGGPFGVGIIFKIVP